MTPQSEQKTLPLIQMNIKIDLRDMMKIELVVTQHLNVTMMSTKTIFLNERTSIGTTMRETQMILKTLDLPECLS
ncbi:MAG: hypothetical protein C5B54_01685 [Acidobacteria bacterium]|nr:MAG: hypothetical protein C5B54_01685 [Acidobacteriota bacterium]